MATQAGVREAGSDRVSRAQRWLGAIAVVAVAAGTLGAYRLASDDERRSAEQVADALVAEASAIVASVVEEATAALRGANVVVDAAGVIDRDDFAVFAEGVLEPPTHALVLGAAVTADEREAFEAGAGPIMERRPDGVFAPAPPADEYFPLVDSVSDDPGILRTDGFDYATDAVRAEAVTRARDQGSSVLSAATRLRVNDAVGYVVVQPLYRRGAPLETVEQRRAAFVGFVSAGYDAAEVLAVIGPALPPGTGLRLADGDATLFRTGELDGTLARTSPVAVPGRTWLVTTRPAGGIDTASPRAILAGGAVTVAGLLLLFAVTARYQSRLRAAYAAQRKAQRRSETLEGLAARLSQSLSSAEAAEALLGYLRPYTGTAGGAVLALDDAGGDRLHLLAADGYDPVAEARLAEVRLGPSALGEAVRSGEPVWASSPLAWRDDPSLEAFAGAGQAAAVVPLVVDGRAVGVLVLVHSGVRTFYEDERSLLVTVGALAARALLRARRYDAEHDAAEVLQRSLLPARLPPIPDVAVAVRYLPAGGGLAVGGDFYDVFPLPEGRVGLVVGDVVGRGVRAAAAMGQLRSSLRAFTSVISEPAALLQAFERHVGSIPDALCATMVYAVLDPAAGRMSYVRAGHPPPVRVGRSGPAELLVDALSPPLGVTGGPPSRPATVDLAPDDAVILYTDGMVERRGEPVTVGLERLRRAASGAAGLDAEACCDRIVAELLGSGAEADDAAVLVVRLEPSSAGTPPDDAGVGRTGRTAAGRPAGPAVPFA